ncbi:alpha/beta fold hydrolase [Paenibacillus cookii]|uniref:AB hydrolase-1 domain-containing protein n=1 Tax=Paenibacillus cookii TaxID=157839 RepID=A0ABQ4LXC5_9BACL|nr:alpha/beta hydrolase [Paenibacillus cookii]GIO67907.1 hypothetical protein J21TS3_27280 [Paenibacillus cookii]
MKKFDHSGSQTGYVFIHGAGLNGGIWKQVMHRLPVPCLSIDFPFRQAEDAIRQKMSLHDYIADINNQIDRWGVERFILVAHSLGGVPALRIAADRREQVAGLAAVGAVIPADGGSFLSVFPPAQRILMAALMRTFGTRPPEQAIRKSLCSGLSPEQAGEIAKHFTPEPLRIYTDKINAHWPAGIPSLYVRLEQDRELPAKLQERMIQNLDGCMTAAINSGHLPMLSHPDELSAILLRFLDGLPAS